MRRSALLLLILLSGAATACRTGAAHPEASPHRYDSDVITLDEIERTKAGDVLALIGARRPQWLRGRGGSSVYAEGGIVAYLDGTRLGPAELLRDVTTEGVALVRFFDGPSATVRFGSGHQHGAIQVVSLVSGT